MGWGQGAPSVATDFAETGVTNRHGLKKQTIGARGQRRLQFQCYLTPMQRAGIEARLPNKEPTKQ